jgi:hypothetical protein
MLDMSSCPKTFTIGLLLMLRGKRLAWLEVSRCSGRSSASPLARRGVSVESFGDEHAADTDPNMILPRAAPFDSTTHQIDPRISHWTKLDQKLGRGATETAEKLERVKGIEPSS